MKPTQQEVLDLFLYDKITGIVVRRIATSRNTKIGEKVGWVNGEGYLNVKINRRSYKLHQVIWLYHYGVWPSGVIDHINRIKTDNRIENLRDTTVQINNINQGLRSDNKTGVKGVTWRARDRRFVAACRVSGKQHYLGSFHSVDDAAKVVIDFQNKRQSEIGKGMA